MPRPESEHPTELELDILKVLWRESPLPVREVRKRLEAEAGGRWLIARSSRCSTLCIAKVICDVRGGELFLLRRMFLSVRLPAA